jgi:hypothetical protein
MKIGLSVFITILAISTVVTGQESIGQCKTNRNAPPAGHFAWLPDTEVKVHFSRGMFTPEQRAALLEAMRVWSQTARQTLAGVTFTYAGETDGSASCNNCLLVTRQSVRKYSKFFAYFTPVQRNSEGQLVSAWIVFDEATINPEALQVFMTHELGHGMGLDNCPNCKKEFTIMRSFPRINKVDNLIEPSVCDLQVVRQVYELQRRVARSGEVDSGRN